MAIILYEAIGQHYGLPTRLLDFTTDLDTALFFAFCYYDAKSKQYRSFESPDEGHSVFYLSDIDLIEYMQTKYSKHDGLYDEICDRADIQPIGFQPFMRCSRQHGFVAYTEDTDNLYQNSIFEKFRIPHDDAFVEYSKYIFKKMKNGDALFPPEEEYGLSELCDWIKSAKTFSEDSFYSAFDSITISESKTKIRKTLGQYGFAIKKPMTYDYPLHIRKKIEEAWSKNNFLLNGEVIPINRPIMKSYSYDNDLREGKGGFWIQTTWGTGNREDSLPKS